MGGGALLVEQLRVLALHAFQLDGYLLTCGDVGACDDKMLQKTNCPLRYRSTPARSSQQRSQDRSRLVQPRSRKETKGPTAWLGARSVPAQPASWGQ